MALANGPRDVSPASLPPIKPHVIVLFGATGDLARRKHLPGLLHLSQTELISDFAVVGTSLEDLDDEGFREFAKRDCRELARHPVTPDELEAFAARLSYVDQASGPAGLAAAVARAEDKLGDDPRRLYHLSVPPAAA